MTKGQTFVFDNIVTRNPVRLVDAVTIAMRVFGLDGKVRSEVLLDRSVLAKAASRRWGINGTGYVYCGNDGELLSHVLAQVGKGSRVYLKNGDRLDLRSANLRVTLPKVKP